MIGCNYKLGSANWREVKSSVLAETLVGSYPSSSLSLSGIFVLATLACNLYLLV